MESVLLKKLPSQKILWEMYYEALPVKEVKDLTIKENFETILEKIKKTHFKLSAEKLTLLAHLLFNHLNEIYSNAEIKYPAFFKGVFLENVDASGSQTLVKFGLDFFSDKRCILYCRDRPKVSGGTKNFYKALEWPSLKRVGRLEALNKRKIRYWGSYNANEINHLLTLKNDEFDFAPKIEKIAVAYSEKQPLSMIIYGKEYQDDLQMIQAKLLNKGYALPLDATLHYCKQLLKILAYLEEKKIVHGDIKAENLLINHLGFTEDGKFDYLKSKIVLIDWSYAFEEGTLSKALGSFEYMDPLIFFNQASSHRLLCAHNTWSFGHVIWGLFFNLHYPTHFLFNKKNRQLCQIDQNRKNLKAQVEDTYQSLSKFQNPLALLFRGMFDPLISQRLKAQELMLLLNQIENEKPHLTLEYIAEMIEELYK